jgi:hypothetical protein
MAVKPVKVLTDLQTNKQITKVDRAAGNAVLFNVSGTVAGGGHVSSSLPITSSGLLIGGDAIVSGTLYVRTYHSIETTASVLYESGSSKFGNSADDTHQFTGSVSISGSFSAHYLTASYGLYSGGPSELSGAVTANNGLTILGAPLNASAVAVSASALNVSTVASVGGLLSAGGLSSSAGLTVTGSTRLLGSLSGSSTIYAPIVSGNVGAFATGSVATSASFNNIAVITSSQTVGGVLYDMYSIDQAFHAIDTVLADSSKTQNAYKRLRYQTSGTFDVSGIQLVALPLTQYSGSAFTTSSLDYITVDVMVKLESTDNWMNDVVAIETYITGSPGSEYVEVAIHSADVPYAYRLIALNEDPSKYVI